MTPSDFMQDYERATNTHDFATVAPLIAADAIFWFNDGSFHGLDQIQAAFEKTWGAIQEERYAIENVQWIGTGEAVAVCAYHFRWQGYISGNLRSGRGRGTSVLRKDDGRWRVAHEHLSATPG
jgi:uncharacterized protein (TIGR02246 family)